MIRAVKLFFFSLTLFLGCITLNYASQDSKNKADYYIELIEQSIENANNAESKLPEAILELEGMSSGKIRHFLNNICSIPDANYLEIGVWKGSTWVAALHGNESTLRDAVAIDNWSQFGGTEKEFLKNVRQFISNRKFRHYSEDCFALNKRIFTSPVNIYFYDGEHSEASQEKALTYYDDVLDDVFILIIDDWNWATVKAGTKNALDKLNYEVLYFREMPARANVGIGDPENWWNGLYIAVIKKP